MFKMIELLRIFEMLFQDSLLNETIEKLNVCEIELYTLLINLLINLNKSLTNKYILNCWMEVYKRCIATVDLKTVWQYFI